MDNKGYTEKFLSYSSNLKQMFDKVKKFIPKKHIHYSELTSQLKEINEKINNDKEINVDKYFHLIKMSLETDNIKLIESVLDHMHKLIREDIFIGQTEDKSADRSTLMKFNYFYLKKRYIDVFIDSLVKLYNISDDNILLQCVMVLFSICKNANTNIHNDSFLKIFRFYIRVYLASRTTLNIDTTKSTLNSIVSLFFTRMEQFNAVIFARESSKVSLLFDVQSTLSGVNSNVEYEKSESSLTQSANFFMNTNPNNYLSLKSASSNYANLHASNMNGNKRSSVMTNGGLTNDIYSIGGFARSQNSINSNINNGLGNSFLPSLKNNNNNNNNNLNYRNPVDNMLQKVLTSLVDDVCVVYEKEIHLNNLKKEVYNYGTEEIKLELLGFFKQYANCTKNINDKINLLKSTPHSLDYWQLNSEYYERLFLANPKAKNEKGQESGNYGWCYICRNKADLYCKTTRLPVCSLSCKLKIAEEDEEIQKYISGEALGEDDIALLYLHDTQSIFTSLCKLVNSNVDSNENNNLKAKMIALELILNILEKPGNIFVANKEFISIIKVDLMEGLLRSCMSDDLTIYSYSIKIFFKVWNFFREHLKHQIAVFIETVFLKILDSGNSSYNHKWLLLENFYKLAGTAKFFVELYVNYDCDIEEKDLLNRIVISLSKISQGKYARSEHQLTPQQEYQLRSRSLEVICMMIRSVLMFTQDQIGSSQKGVLNFNEGGNLDNANVNKNENEDNMNFDDQISVLDTNNGASFYNTVQTSNFEANLIREKLDYNRKIKSDISTAVEKFNIKIKNGIMYLKKAGIINSENKDLEAFDIANFLRNTHGLKKENIGEFLGENQEISLKTLDYYTQSFDFTEMHIIEAIRVFLSGFRLPGEGQKIDRIMEKFAAKFYKDNTNVFATADCAYYLAFSIIMLQTDTHNPQVKKKMGIEGFKKMLKGINGGKDFEENFINDIYKQISEKPISLTEFEEEKDKLEAGAKKKTDLFKKETERMYEEGTQKLKKHQTKLYLKICETDHIELMLESIWTALLAMFSLIMEDSEDNNMNNLSVEGLSNCIKLCGMLNLDLQKEALIRAFCKLTNITQGKEIKEKHLHCIRAILTLANFDGNYLKGSWKLVLELISKIDYYHMTVSGSKAELESFFADIRNKKRQLNNQNINIEREILIEKNNMEKIGRDISPDDYEIIFNRTASINDETLIDFVKSLCEISKQELASKDAPRIFSLQKLVEVAEINITRIRITWSQIWTIISEHLTYVGSNPSPNIAEKAIDSLRQLAKKLLLRDEISVYQFQTEFLKPFENILINNINSYRTKEYVLTCITNLVLAEAASIKSGWRIIFSIFSLASDDDNSQQELKRKTFETIMKVFNNHFSQIKDNYNEMSYCVKRYSKNYPEECITIYKNSYDLLEEIPHVNSLLLCLGSLIRDNRENIRNVASAAFFYIVKKITESTINDHQSTQKFCKTTKMNSSGYTFNPTLTFKENSNNNSSGNPSIASSQKNADIGIRSTIKIDYANYSQTVTNNTNLPTALLFSKIYYDSDFWNKSYKNIFNPVIDDLIAAKYSTTLEIFLVNFNDIFMTFFDKIDFLLENYLATLTTIITSDNESIALAGFEAFKILIEKLSSNPSSKINIKFWDQIIKTTADVFNKTRQVELLSLNISNFNNPEFQSIYQDIVYKNVIFCIIQHNLIELSDNIIELHYEKINFEHLNILMDCLRESWELAYNFNVEFNLRQLISYHFMSALNNVAALFKQQQDGTYIFFKALIKIYESEISNKEIKADARSKIISNSKKILKDFVDRINYNEDQSYLFNENERLLNNMVPVILECIFKNLEKVDFLRDDIDKEDFIKIFIDLIACNVLEIRFKVRDLLSELFKNYYSNKMINDKNAN